MALKFSREAPSKGEEADMTHEELVERAKQLCAERALACWTIRIESTGKESLGLGYASLESAMRACKNAVSYAEYCGHPCRFEIVGQ